MASSGTPSAVAALLGISMTVPAIEGRRLDSNSADLPRSLPAIRLQHGEALWVLAELGFQGKVRKSTFYEYVKSLRKLGTPFEW
jgi:hypothetical protein